MSDLIERQAAIDAVKEAVISAEWKYAEEALEKLPSAQLELIHCEHCKHGVHSGRGDTYLCVVSPEELSEHKYDFFCGYGESREG